MVQQTLAIDFGTSNSAAAVLEKGRVRRLSIEADADTLPTAVFFAPKGGEMLIGEAASAALIGGEEGRYMRARHVRAERRRAPRVGSGRLGAHAALGAARRLEPLGAAAARRRLDAGLCALYGGRLAHAPRM